MLGYLDSCQTWCTEEPVLCTKDTLKVPKVIIKRNDRNIFKKYAEDTQNYQRIILENRR